MPFGQKVATFFAPRRASRIIRGWRLSGEVIGDAAVVICSQPAGAFTGNILYDELVMLNEGGLSTGEVAKRYPVEA